MSEIERFANGEFDIELIPDGDSFIVRAPGVARGLAFKDAHTMLRSLPEDEKGSALVRTPGGDQTVWHLKEPGLYRVIGQRQAARIKNEAIRGQVERFQHWLFHEVLPALRKTGTYSVPAVEEPKPLAVAGAPVSYLEQAQIVAVLVQAGAIPVLYATATSKIIVARSMGERPQLEPAETPLYAATFLAEQGHRARTVREFQSGFGLRVSNRYFKVHGRRPEKIPGPAGSRIDKVAVYTEDDRPLLQEVYDQIADLIGVFEHGDQLVIEAGAA